MAKGNVSQNLDPHRGGGRGDAPEIPVNLPEIGTEPVEAPQKPVGAPELPAPAPAAAPGAPNRAQGQPQRVAPRQEAAQPVREEARQPVVPAASRPAAIMAAELAEAERPQPQPGRVLGRAGTVTPPEIPMADPGVPAQKPARTFMKGGTVTPPEAPMVQDMGADAGPAADQAADIPATLTSRLEPTPKQTPVKATPTPRPEAEAAVDAEPAEAIISRLASSNPHLTSEVEVEAAPREQVPATVFKRSRDLQRLTAQQSLESIRRGSATNDTLSADPDVRLDEISLSAEMLLAAYRQPGSILRDIMSKSPSITDATMADDKTATAAIVSFFNRHDVEGLTEKSPATDEASAHRRIVRAHFGPGTLINPIVFTMWNADFDGDEMKVTFDPAAYAGVKSAMDFLIGTEGEGKIDPGFFDMAIWGSVDEVKDRLRKMFVTDTRSPVDITERQITGLAEAIVASSSSDTADEGFRSLLRWCRAVGERYLVESDRGRATERILSDIQRMNKDIRLIRFLYEGGFDSLGIPVVDPDVVESSPVPAFPDLITKGTAPSNLYSWGTATNTPIGYVEKRNVHFRVGASLAKLSKQLRAIFGNEAYEGNLTADDITARMISGLRDFDEHLRGVTDQARRMVLEEVGFPSTGSPEEFHAFLTSFMWAYNRSAAAVNAATARIRLDKTIVPHDRLSMPAIPTDDPVALRSALRTQFKHVYGGYTMERLFGAKAPKGYENVTLDEFVHTNRASDPRILGTKDTPFTTPEQFIGRLADMRTSFPHKYHKLMTEALEKQITITPKGKRTKIGVLLDVRASKRPYALDVELENVAESLYLLGPEVFTFLGLDSPAAFAGTALGRKFVDAKSADELGGVLYEAVARYRLEPAMRYRRLWREAKTGSERGHYQAKFESELRRLESSSDTWGSLVRAWRDYGVDIFGTVLYADLPRSKKDVILNDLVKGDPLGRPNQEPYEVTAGLFADPQGLYGKNRFTSDFGHSVLLDNIKQSSDKIDGYAKANWAYYKNAVTKAHKDHAKPGSLTSFLDAVAQDPSLTVTFEPWMIADAVLSGMEKTFRSSEKSQQEGASSYIYTAVNNLLNAGVWSDLAVGGDFALGQIALDRFLLSPRLVARVLTDPDFEITVYDDTGSALISRAVLLGDNPHEEDIWAWLEDHPRAAAALRSIAMTNDVNPKSGMSYPTATASLSKTMADVTKALTSRNRPDTTALKALADHPGFYAMVGLTVRMQGMKRAQLRDSASASVYKVIRLIRSLSGSPFPVEAAYEYVDEMFVAAGYDVDRLNAVYELGQAQEEGSEDPGADDVTDTEEYEIAQIKRRLSEDLSRYSKLLAATPEVKPLPRMAAADAADLFALKDPDTLRSYFDIIQTMISAKTAVSTSINGGESRRNGALMFLATLVPERCAADARLEVGWFEFERDWRAYELQKAYIPAKDGEPERWIVVNEVTVDEILEASLGGPVLIEDPAACADPLCACVRHATGDQSTNLSGLQTPAFGRLLTIVRTLSSEGLNLKSKTQGDDGTDSIVKNRIFDIIDTDIEFEVAAAYRQEGLPAARTVLAEHLAQTFHDMKYSNEMLMADYINVAQILIREVPGPGDTKVPRVLSIGRLNSIVKAALERAIKANPELTMRDVEAAVVAALNDPTIIDGELDIESALARINVPSEIGNIKPGLISQRESSIARNLELVKEIFEETDAKPLSDAELDRIEFDLLGKHPKLRAWSDYAGSPGKTKNGGAHRFGTERKSYRIIGLVNKEGTGSITRAVGPRNAWVIDAQSPRAAEAIAACYRYGINVLLEGRLSEAAWAEVSERTMGAIDDQQGVTLSGGRTLIPTFDIRLNGGNTAMYEGAFNAGVFFAKPEDLYFFYENPANEADLGDSEFVAYESFVRHLRVRKTGEYRVPVRAAYANLLWGLRNKRDNRNPYVEVASKEDILTNFLDPYVSEIADDAPAEFAMRQAKIDTGTEIIEEGSNEDVRLREGIQRFLARSHELGDDGLLPSCGPDEIIGFMRAEIDGEVRYHPIRPFEPSKSSGAPTSLEIEGVAFDADRQELVVNWAHQGSMEGRLFKIFEGGFSANKFMARSKALPDVKLKNGVKLSGHIARQSTASRRLLLRRQQKMMTLMYMARIAPYGYNLAETEGAFPDAGDAALRDGLLDGSATLAMWDTRLRAGDINFFPEHMGDINALANDMARRAVRYGINPTVVFASHHGGVPNNAWFNFQVLFDRTGSVFQGSLMKFMHQMMPTLCPPGVEDTGGTLFNGDLQVLVPLEYKDPETGEDHIGEQWVDLYGGFHFLDEHFSGNSASGATVSTRSIPTINTLIPGGREMSSSDIVAYLHWAGIGDTERAWAAGWMLPEDSEEAI